jgi:hypothetical protein
MNPATASGFAQMSIVLIFFLGMAGSGLVELATGLKHYESSGVDNGNGTRSKKTLPDWYSDPKFWVLRGLLAVAAGGLAVLYEVDKPLLAVNIGASAPLLIQMLAQGAQQTPVSPPVHAPRQVPSGQPDLNTDSTSRG